MLPNINTPTLRTKKPPLDIEELVPEMNCLKRVCVRLHPRREANVPASTSKLGGTFLLNQERGWPYCEEHKTYHVAGLQLLRSDFPELPFPTGTNLLQVTWCPDDHKDRYCPLFNLRWIMVDENTVCLPHNPGHSIGEDHYIPKECRLHPERVVEYIDRWGLPAVIAQKIESRKELIALAKKMLPNSADNPLGVYQTLLGAAPGTKLLGHPEWIQDPEFPKCSCGCLMEYLLTVASWEWDGASCIRWKPEGDQTTSLGGGDADLMFGDAGNVYVYICRNHTPWRFDRIMQCS
jgi:hypothetical protein